jgi:hypothetical protein
MTSERKGKKSKKDKAAVSEVFPAAVFKFGLRQVVVLNDSEEHGTVIARSESIHADPQYMLRYKCADGRAVEAWWSEEALRAA